MPTCGEPSAVASGLAIARAASCSLALISSFNHKNDCVVSFDAHRSPSAVSVADSSGDAMKPSDSTYCRFARPAGLTKIPRTASPFPTTARRPVSDSFGVAGISALADHVLVTSPLAPDEPASRWTLRGRSHSASASRSRASCDVESSATASLKRRRASAYRR